MKYRLKQDSYDIYEAILIDASIDLDIEWEEDET